MVKISGIANHDFHPQWSETEPAGARCNCKALLQSSLVPLTYLQCCAIEASACAHFRRETKSHCQKQIWKDNINLIPFLPFVLTGIQLELLQTAEKSILAIVWNFNVKTFSIRIKRSRCFMQTVSFRFRLQSTKLSHNLCTRHGLNACG